MSLLIHEGPELKARLEQGVWFDAVERSYTAWFSAPNHKKPELLLTGPTLTWAESWMLAQPKELSASLKQYIIRSLTAQSRISASQREGIEQEQRRKDSVYRYLLITMSVFALLVLAPGIVRDMLGFQFDSNIPDEIARGPQSDPNNPGDPAVVSSGPAIEPGATQVPEPVAVTPATVESPFAKLARAIQIQSDKGDARLASLLAVEFFEQLKASPATKSDERLRELTLTIVGDSFASRGLAAPDSVGLSEQSVAVGCQTTERFVGVSRARQILVWDGAAMRAPIDSAQRPKQIKTSTIDRDCARLVTVSDDYELFITPLLQGAKPIKLGAHESDVVGIGLSGDGSKVVSVSRDSVGKVWDARAGRRLADLRVDDVTLTGAALSIDGTRAVTWSEEQVAQVWDAATGRILGKLTAHQASITRAEFSADGSRILTLSIDGTAIVWDAVTYVPLHALTAVSGSVIDARMSPDGRYIATMNEAATVSIFDATSEESVSEFTTGSGKIRALVFSPDGKLVATVDWSGAIAIWRTADGERLLGLNRRVEPIATLMFNREGTELAALTTSGSVVTWPLLLDVEPALARVKSAAYACLSGDERRRFLLETSDVRACVSVEQQPEPIAAGALAYPSPTDAPDSPYSN